MTKGTTEEGTRAEIVAFYKGGQVAVFPREGRRQEDVLAAITGHRIEGAVA